MIITFLGTSSGAPTPTRNVSGLALWFIQRGKWWLFDCGEGTQHQVLKSPLKLSQLENIFITHLHGDHVYGLIGLLASRSIRGGDLSPVTVYGPPGIDRYVDSIMAVSPVFLQYPLRVRAVAPGVVYEDDEVVVRCAEAAHRVPSLAYAVEEKPRPGAFLADKAKAAGIPQGPLYGRLKRGETVLLPDGRVVDGRDFVSEPQPGRKVVYSGDTGPSASVISLARGADVLIHEATYAHAHLDLAVRSGHSTAVQAAEAARSAGVGTLILTHFSPRYEGGEGEEGAVSLEQLAAEARDLFPDTVLAHDFYRHEVKRKRPGTDAHR